MRIIETGKMHLDFRGKRLPVTIQIKADQEVLHIVVSASVDGTDFKASDSLGGCFISSDQDVLNHVRENNMLGNVVQELYDNIVSAAKICNLN